MTQTQKIIKYFAVGLAIFLIISIFSTLFGIASNIFGFSLQKENDEYKIETIASSVDNLEIEINFSKLIFKNSAEFKVETNNEYITVRHTDNGITIKEKTKLFSSKPINSEVIIYVPTKKNFNNVSIEAGSGNLEINSLTTNTLDLDLGAGSITFKNLNVSNEVSIDSGAGKLTIENAYLNNLDLDMGVGEVNVSGILIGSSDIDAGIGSLKLNLTNAINNYGFVINKGIGSIKINDEVISDSYYETKGNNLIKIDGGIGSIVVNTLRA